MKLGRLSEVTQIRTVRRVQGNPTVLCAVGIFLLRKIEMCLLCGTNLSLGETPEELPFKGCRGKRALARELPRQFSVQ